MRNIEVRIPTEIEPALKLELMEKIISKSKLKEKDVEILDNVIKNLY